MRLSEKYGTVFITGASSGLGLAYTEMLLAEGLQVWGTSRDAARLRELSSREGFHPVILDLGNPAQAEASFRKAEQETDGGFDLVIQNAGYGLFAPFAAVDAAQWQAQLECMVLSFARLSHAAFSGMLRRRKGTLVQVSSLAVEFPLPFMSGYNMAKAAVSALSESLMLEARGSGVVVIDFRPGDYCTDFNRAMKRGDDASLRDPRVANAWERLEQNLREAPGASHAARNLRRALSRGRSGIVRSGSFFQARVACAFAFLSPAPLRRLASAIYFKVR